MIVCVAEEVKTGKDFYFRSRNEEKRYCTMSLLDIALLAALTAAVTGAVRVCLRRKKKGGCGCGCDGCDGCSR